MRVCLPRLFCRLFSLKLATQLLQRVFVDRGILLVLLTIGGSVVLLLLFCDDPVVNLINKLSVLGVRHAKLDMGLFRVIADVVVSGCGGGPFFVVIIDVGALCRSLL